MSGFPSNRFNVASASLMIVAMSSATVGRSSITPDDLPARQHAGVEPAVDEPGLRSSIGVLAAIATCAHVRPWFLLHREAFAREVVATTCR